MSCAYFSIKVLNCTGVFFLLKNYDNQPLPATFEKIARFGFVKKRYQEMIKNLPNVWIVADFDKKTIPSDELSENTKFLSCKDTDLANMWTVITRGPYGPFGLIAEEFEEGKFRGFFTLNPNVCRHVLKIMGKTLGTNFTLQ